jgi:hypothetical protein
LEGQKLAKQGFGFGGLLWQHGRQTFSRPRKGATLDQRSCGCQFIQACLFTAASATAQYKQGPDVGIERWLVPLVYYVGVDTHPCCVTSFVYSEDRNDRAVACEWPLFSCRRALWPSIDWVSSFVSSPAIYLPRRYLPSHFLSRLDPTISPFRVRSFCETIASATKLPRQVPSRL